MKCFQVILEIIPVNDAQSSDTCCVLRFQNGLSVYFDTPEEAVSYLRKEMSAVEESVSKKDSHSN